MSHSVLICVFSVYFDIQTTFGTHKDPYEEWSYCDFFSEDGIVLESQMVLPVIYELISSLVPLAGNSHLCNIFFLCISGFGTGTTHSNMDESIVGMSVCVLSCFSHIQLIATLWAFTCQAPLSSGVLQARILAWVAMHSSRESSQPKNPNRVSYVYCIGREFLYHQRHRLWLILMHTSRF